MKVTDKEAIKATFIENYLEQAWENNRQQTQRNDGTESNSPQILNTFEKKLLITDIPGGSFRKNVNTKSINTDMSEHPIRSLTTLTPIMHTVRIQQFKMEIESPREVSNQGYRPSTTLLNDDSNTHLNAAGKKFSNSQIKKYFSNQKI